jgi:hypothetical protein
MVMIFTWSSGTKESGPLPTRLRDNQAGFEVFLSRYGGDTDLTHWEAPSRRLYKIEFSRGSTPKAHRRTCAPFAGHPEGSSRH